MRASRSLMVAALALFFSGPLVVPQEAALATDPPQSRTVTAPLHRVGGVDCAGHPQQQEAGTVTVVLTEQSMEVTVNVTDDLHPSQAFSVEGWEEAPGCYSDNALKIDGVVLTTDGSGSGSTTFTLPLPWTRNMPGGGTVVLGDGAGTERLVLVLDRSGSTTGEDTYSAGPIDLGFPSTIVEARYTAEPHEFARKIHFDASGSVVPAGAEAEYRWIFARGEERRSGLGPVIDYDYGDSTAPIEVTLTVSARGVSDTASGSAGVPADTVVIFLKGIGPYGLTGGEDSSPTKDSAWKQVAGQNSFGGVLTALGCADLSPGRTLTKQCNTTDRSRLFWSPFSYRGLNEQGMPNPYGGRDTWVPLSVSSGHLDTQIGKIHEERPEADIVLVGYSEGGTVATRWAADRTVGHRSPGRRTPVITLDSMPYGFWPDDRNTPQAEDKANYCGPTSEKNQVATPRLEGLPWDEFLLLCTAGWPHRGFRSDVSYDWRGQRSFGQDGAVPRATSLQLFSATNREDLVAPPWWNVSPYAARNTIVSCGSALFGHKCVLSDAGVHERILNVVTATMAAAEERRPPEINETAPAWGESTPAEKLAGFTTEISVPANGRVAAVGEWGRGDGAGARTLTCVDFTARAPGTVVVTSDDWRARSYVVFWYRKPASPAKPEVLMRSQVRVLPYLDTKAFQAQVGKNLGRLNAVENPCLA
ncbi:hypothetical protein [Sphaerisporangium sp. NPDC051011]|uniref:hypothetical protein n=1 Tax=Sphaerisporangium sp. NPDC051011 TaxID=3155792 RepID=UPI0033F10A9D